MTGLYPHQHGICSNVHNLGSSVHELPDSPRLLSRRLQNAGYRCGYTGKWHLGTESGEAFGGGFRPCLPRDVGFEGQNFPGHGGGGFGYPEYKEYLAANGYPHEVRQAAGVSTAANCNGITFGVLAGPEESTVPYFLADHTIGLVDNFHDSGRPFFLWHNFWGPHGPFYAPGEYYEIYRNIEIPEWPNYRWDEAGTNRPHQVKLHPDRERLTWDDWAEAVRHYYAFTTLIDRQIGRIVEHLRETGLLDDTWVIFTADHGETIGSHGGLTDKGWHHFEEIQRIPFIVRPPDSWDGPRGTVRGEWASLLDIYPTILDVASPGAAKTGSGDLDTTTGPNAANPHDGSGNVSGASLLPLIKGEQRPWRDTVFVEFNGVNSLATSMVTVRKGDLKYGWNCSSRDELYDLGKDPWEMKNVAEDPACANRLHEMRVILADWMQETGYPGRGMYLQNRLGGRDRST
jgi:arylsulfatase A-like enzyme